ncbi:MULTISPECIES: hypothetical protein [Vibrio]|nr:MULTISPECIES: hypothetical protein [Vibrio]EKO3836778.1 hypothetical protein [Vibrio harveyi]EKO3849928.1 hypothetical protein [Vibrio harveyi]ELH7811449.1 hypothetical protein [Vibrio harveyi]ELV8719971.1 hypothetical protein [Vibrio harveyi]EMR36043.1 hypothetical protein MUQ_15160 [Vibrio harveyi CAIM 1792]
MNLNFYQIDPDVCDEWDTTLNEPLLVMRDANSTDIPSLGEFFVLPVGSFLYKTTKIIRRVEESRPDIFTTTDVDIILTPALID